MICGHIDDTSAYHNASFARACFAALHEGLEVFTRVVIVLTILDDLWSSRHAATDSAALVTGQTIDTTFPHE